MTKAQFSFRNIAYREKDGSFTGVCLDLDIVEEGHVSLQEAILSIEDAVLSHFKAAEKMGFPKELVNRRAPKEYWNKLRYVTQEKVQTQNFPPFQFFTTESSSAAYV